MAPALRANTAILTGLSASPRGRKTGRKTGRKRWAYSETDRGAEGLKCDALIARQRCGQDWFYGREEFHVR